MRNTGLKNLLVGFLNSLLATQLMQCIAVCCSVLQCVSVCCNVLQCVAECCSVLQSVAVCCSVLQCVAVCCSVLQCVAVLQTYVCKNAQYFCKRALISRTTAYFSAKDSLPPKDWEIALRLATNLSISCFLALPGSESRFIDVTEYIYFSLI